MKTYCCPTFRAALTPGTDSEGWQQLIWDEDGVVEMGQNLPQINFCPWCGSRIAQEK